MVSAGAEHQSTDLLYIALLIHEVLCGLAAQRCDWASSEQTKHVRNSQGLQRVVCARIAAPHMYFFTLVNMQHAIATLDEHDCDLRAQPNGHARHRPMYCGSPKVLGARRLGPSTHGATESAGASNWAVVEYTSRLASQSAPPCQLCYQEVANHDPRASWVYWHGSESCCLPRTMHLGTATQTEP